MQTEFKDKISQLEQNLSNSKLQLDKKDTEISEKTNQINEIQSQIKSLQSELFSLQTTFAEKSMQTNLEIGNALKQSAHDSDEVSLVLIENENLKRKIKMLEIDSVKQNKLEKLNQKINEKEENIKSLQEVLGSSQKTIVT